MRKKASETVESAIREVTWNMSIKYVSKARKEFDKRHAAEMENLKHGIFDDTDISEKGAMEEVMSVQAFDEMVKVFAKEADFVAPFGTYSLMEEYKDLDYCIGEVDNYAQIRFTNSEEEFEFGEEHTIKLNGKLYTYMYDHDNDAGESEDGVITAWDEYCFNYNGTKVSVCLYTHPEFVPSAEEDHIKYIVDVFNRNVCTWLKEACREGKIA